MNPTDFPAATHHLVAPKTWDKEAHGECGTLPVERLPHGWRSLWRPSPLDLKILANGGVVELVVYGDGHPPVMLDTLASTDKPALAVQGGVPADPPVRQAEGRQDDAAAAASDQDHTP